MEFRIKALDTAQEIIACVVDAVDEADARRQLDLRELKVVSLAPVRHLRLLGRAPQLQLAVFSQQLVSLLDAGLSLVEALEAQVGSRLEGIVASSVDPGAQVHGFGYFKGGTPRPTPIRSAPPRRS